MEFFIYFDTKYSHHPTNDDYFHNRDFSSNWLHSLRIAELPEPEIKEFQGGILVTLFKDNLTNEQLIKLGLNDRQLKAINFVKEKGKITNKEYQELKETSDRTALRDLENLTELNILVKGGEKKGTSYKLKSGGYMADK